MNNFIDEFKERYKDELVMYFASIREYPHLTPELIEEFEEWFASLKEIDISFISFIL